MRIKETHVYTAIALAALLAVLAHYLWSPWGFYWNVPQKEQEIRLDYIQTAQSYLGYNELDGTHSKIIDLYNAHEPLAMDYQVQYTDSWCSTFLSAVAIQCGLTEIIPTECGCQRHIGLFDEMGCWIESDTHIPLPGDLIFYDWDMKKPGESLGWSDHVGIVVGTKWPFVKVIEGNKEDMVSYRILLLGDISIRGYGKPDYSKISK